MNISAPFVRRPIATSLLTVAILLAGMIAYNFLPVAPLPQVEFPTIQVQASLPGASPEIMASSVATPLERQFGRIAGVTEMTSSSLAGNTSITLQFDLNRDIDAAARDVQAAINAAAGQLPANLPSLPTYKKANPADSPVMILAVRSDVLPISRLYDIASSIIAQKLSQVEGVGQVNIGGGALPAVRIELNPTVLAGYGLGLEDIRTALGQVNSNEPKGEVANGRVQWTLYDNDQLFDADHYRPLVDAEFAINEGGGGALRNGKPFRMSVQHAEKVYQTYVLEVTDPGGHSASGRRDNAIYRLAEALRRLGQFDFPPALNPVTRSFFQQTLAVETPPVADAIKALLDGSTDAAVLMPLTTRPEYNSVMRTTCVPTLLEAGHAENALPQTARATVNCRILPDQPVAEVERALVSVVADDKVKITPKGQAVLSPPSPINPEIMHAVETLAGEMWPGVPVIPTMSGGYTDSRWLRNAGIPSYGVSGLFTDPVNNGVHGLNEQVRVKDLYASKAFLYRLVKVLAGPGQPSTR